ncbi:Src-associated protein-like protein [Giardia muris]|uniref:Src-associated protein-like protein n=1 Tax=Giardia muris TaxID=5742 RepID=A0A4Z1SR13_GIAMU|nr:Src-associated protein-like protein [Giardia muris]|eukprot:TNJ28312.1 Src-associated protein-like protein [Giardia muris]
MLRHTPLVAMPTEAETRPPLVAFCESFSHQTAFELYGGAVPALSPNMSGTDVAVATSNRVVFLRLPESDITTGTSRLRASTTAVAYRHDGELYAAADESGAVEVFTPGQASWLKRFYDSTEPVGGVCFTSDGLRLAAVTRTGRLFVWAIGTEELQFATQAHNDVARNVLMLGENTCVTIGYDGYLRVWDIREKYIEEDVSQDQKKRKRASGGPSLEKDQSSKPIMFEYDLCGPIDCFYTAEGYLYVGAGGHIYSFLISQQADTLELKPFAQSDSIAKGVSCLSVQTTAHGTLLFAGCFDGTIRVFDARTLVYITNIARLPHAVLSLTTQRLVLRSHAFAIVVGQNANLLTVFSTDSLPVATQKAIKELTNDKPKERTREELIAMARQNIDYAVHSFQPRPSLTQVDMFLAIGQGVRALKLGLVKDREITASILLELECRGFKAYRAHLSELTTREKIKLFVFCKASIGNQMLVGPFLRACTTILEEERSETMEPDLRQVVIDFTKELHSELQLISELSELKRSLTWL